MNRLSSWRRCAPGLLTVAALQLAGCAATPLKQPLSGYTCCNLRIYYGDWVSTHNVLGGSMVPAGSRAEFGTIKKMYYLYGTLDGRDFGLRNDYGHAQAQTLRWANLPKLSGPAARSRCA